MKEEDFFLAPRPCGQRYGRVAWQTAVWSPSLVRHATSGEERLVCGEAEQTHKLTVLGNHMNSIQKD